MNKIFFDKLFPAVVGINHSGLLIDSESMSFITTPYYSKIIGYKIRAHLAQFGVEAKACIVDSTACVGGDSITFGILFDRVISIELNDKWYEYLKNNVNHYGLENVVVMKGNSLDIIPNLSDSYHAIYIDPPWGGKQYKLQQNLRLSLGSKSLEHAIVDLFSQTLCLIAVKLPRNYDLKYFYDTIMVLGENKFNIYLYELKKINLVIIQNRDLNCVCACG